MRFFKHAKPNPAFDLDQIPSLRAKLLQLMEERPAVEEWRATLTDYERRNLNNPVTVWRKWTAATRVKKPKPHTASVSSTEHGRARAAIEELQARNAELEEELKAAREPAQRETSGQVGHAAEKALQERLDEIEVERNQARAEVQRLREVGVGAGKNLLHNEAFQSRLKKIIEGLATQGGKNMVTMVPAVVMIHTIELERLLVDHSIWTGSKRRNTDPGWRERVAEKAAAKWAG